MSPLHLSDLVPEWCDLDQGVAHLGQGVAQLSQVLSFLAEIIIPLLADVLFLAEIITARVPMPSCLLNTPCHSLLFSLSHLRWRTNPVVPCAPAEEGNPDFPDLISLNVAIEATPRQGGVGPWPRPGSGRQKLLMAGRPLVDSSELVWLNNLNLDYQSIPASDIPSSSHSIPTSSSSALEQKVDELASLSTGARTPMKNSDKSSNSAGTMIWVNKFESSCSALPKVGAKLHYIGLDLLLHFAGALFPLFDNDKGGEVIDVAPKGEEASGIERSTFALFMQPDCDGGGDGSDDGSGGLVEVVVVWWDGGGGGGSIVALVKTSIHKMDEKLNFPEVVHIHQEAPKGEEASGIERSTFALFMQPDCDFSNIASLVRISVVKYDVETWKE
ncbi:hypothetical protein TEA_016620 [Camellia sinensis var. sinensis]|uniref:Uncharacterized protein n=1 Tax=Camellia sinensis var. sinensis TaxID=542762 RepID=A0A4S4DUD3_CAMSN|nr:hypothetical protein TEA_016620 [Camellia sinensis var. sinensis]